MRQAIGETLAVSAGIMISPIPFAGLIAILASKGGRNKAIAFCLGYFVAVWLSTFLLAWVGHEVKSLFGGSGGPSPWGIVAQGALGVALLVLAIWTLAHRGEVSSRTEEPKWMKAVDSASLLEAAGMGVFLVLANAKNLPLIVSAAIEYAHANLGTLQLAVVVTVFALVGSLFLFFALLLALLASKASAKLLREMRIWVAANSATILAVIFLIMGVTMLGKAISAPGPG